ncbi:hypothetical protein FE257_011342 [Aspergillus nanangensis]|uniref:Carboxylic ester hydrolase n=1 Tax=Aspergillus nanangensis TaxID=2582783 RepID=A0AAD4GRI1_ASPNN|nr:hypothetical protein FE257_011342 [Aspergillus nanangensis]
MRSILASLLSLIICVSAYDDPLVHLDYGSFQGKYDPSYNLTYFRKIPFAAPPTGENRFRAPQPPIPITNGIYNTDQSFDMCPQRTVNGSEDCLYLGLFSLPWTPTTTKHNKTKRPVLVVFYGGAFIQGSASFTMPPSSFPVLNSSTLNDYLVIYPNYRVNALGFLPGSAVKNDPTSDLNPGLLDQHSVLKWVQSHIHHFGGDPTNVTIWGQSAGGGSVVAQLLADEASDAPPLFNRALASSPFWPKTYAYDAPESEHIYERFTNLTGCQTAPDPLHCLKSVDLQTIRNASLAISADHTWTTSSYTWAPVIDGEFLQRTLTQATTGRRRLRADAVFAMYNTHEGENFVPAGLAEADWKQWLQGFVPGLSHRELRRVEELYADVIVADGNATTSSTAASAFVRAGLVYRDLVLACPAYWVAGAADRVGYLGQYTIAPARHASDTIYWNTVNPIQQTDPLVYHGYAGAFASFFQTGDPNAHKLTGAEVLGVPRLRETGLEFVVTEDGFENWEVTGLRERSGPCAGPS